MSKSTKNKKTKVPKLTEAEYARYISALREGEEGALQAPMSATNVKMTSPQSPVATQK